MRLLEEGGPGFSGAMEDLRKRSSLTPFWTRSGAARTPTELLLGEEFKEVASSMESRRRQEVFDEIERAAFAPPERILDGRYASDSDLLELFLFARQRLSAGAEQLAVWARAAAEADRRRAVIRYLVRGTLARELLKELGVNGLHWCLDDDVLIATAIGAGLTARDIDVLRVALLGYTMVPPEVSTPETEDERELDGGSTTWSPEPDIDAREQLDKIAAWWHDHSAKWIRLYESDVYPPPYEGRKLAKELGNRSRDAWITFLTVAACQRFGRQTGSQHRGFIQVLRTKGSPQWWTTVSSAPQGVQAVAWMKILDQWMDGKVDEDAYRTWLGLFPTLYQLHRYGNAYMELFLQAARRPPHAFSLDSLLSPKADPSLTGAGRGFEVPPLGAALGLGGVWALRELVRLGVVADVDHVVRECYVPRRRTRMLLAKLGAKGMDDGSSEVLSVRARSVHEFLVDKMEDLNAARFGRCFDLPLYLIATNSNAREESGVAVEVM